MTFVEALQTCFAKYVDFKGKAAKPEFWWWVLFIVVSNLCLRYISPFLGMLFAVGTLAPSLAVTARRLHDTNKSGWLQLVAIVPILGLILLVYWTIQDSAPSTQFEG